MLVNKSENFIINDEKVLLRSSNSIKTDVFHYSLDTKRGSFPFEEGVPSCARNALLQLKKGSLHIKGTPLLNGRKSQLRY